MTDEEIERALADMPAPAFSDDELELMLGRMEAEAASRGFTTSAPAYDDALLRAAVGL